ncbi:MAG: type II toxin-antitoxin system VapB family antitoxin [Pseudonocardia sp.]
MIDLDDGALALAAKELGTTTKKDTVNAALAFVADRRRRIDANAAEFGTDPRRCGSSAGRGGLGFSRFLV